VKTLVSWSSGNDSAWTVHILRQRGDVEIGGLLTTINEAAQRVAMHAVRVDVLQAQADALGLPLWQIPIPSPCPNEVYERVMAAAVQRAVAEGFTQIAFGDLFLEDIRAYRETTLGKLGMRGLYPVWKRDTQELARSFVDAGFRAVVVCVDGRALDRSFAGRVIDREFLGDLPPVIDPCGENGEFHTFVFDGPSFARPVGFVRGGVSEDPPFVFCDLLPS
jgi:uncharacterized protein (TIGR00290 family)